MRRYLRKVTDPVCLGLLNSLPGSVYNFYISIQHCYENILYWIITFHCVSYVLQIQGYL